MGKPNVSETTKEIDGECYVLASDYDVVTNLYVDTLKELTELKAEYDKAQKENTRLKRIERRQQKRFLQSR